MPEALRAHLDSLPIVPPEVASRSKLATSGDVEGCVCENAAAVEGAMGRVCDAETLTYIIFYPSINKRKSVPDKGFKAVTAKDFDGAFTRGLSVVRGSSPTQFSRAAAVLLGQPTANGEDLPENGVIGVAEFSTKVVRSIPVEDEGSRMFCVFDTPEQMEEPGYSREAHAEIMANHSAKNGLHDDAYRIKVRTELFNIAKMISSINSVAEAALMPYRSKYASE